ncbi:ABC-three component system middle component 1 [Paenibacillus sp. Soil724D2]|uniref:ABC-three component system middle component 1 n=1 Tax=Paenibacillus sp. (strain Soil724D2) TaxID=1736392 RepID=UPI0007162471|nr:ABC-three component system middle component 1 [Paenibacillus sp. Soil724D2]KRE48401.1 hypothetical protein ASG85_05200 [Paenibacillus sp. Soil724D2]
MINLLKKIFTKSGFQISSDILSSSSNAFFAERTNDGKFDFFVIVSINKLKLIDNYTDLFEDYYSTIITNRQGFIGIEKNLSLILLMESNSLQFSKEQSAFIYDIEEDPYFFKKYVLVYTQQQQELVIERINQENEIIEYLNDFLLNPNYFNSFKRSQDSEIAMEYDLVSKLFIKIPFLNMKHEIKKLIKLSDEIRSKMEESDWLFYNGLLENFLNNKNNDPNIEQIISYLGVDIDE